MAMWDMGIDTDPGCGRTTEPDKLLGSSPGHDIIMIPGVVQATWTSMKPIAVQSSGANMTPGGSLDPQNQDSLQWSQGSQKSTQTLDAEGSQTQTRPSVIALVGITPWPQLIALATHIHLVPVVT